MFKLGIINSISWVLAHIIVRPPPTINPEPAYFLCVNHNGIPDGDGFVRGGTSILNILAICSLLFATKKQYAKDK